MTDERQRKGERAWWKGFFDEDYLAAHPQLDAERSVRESERLIQLLGLDGGVRVLDVCCGQGRHARPLAERGFRVAGLDFSATLLRAATVQRVSGGPDSNPAYVRGDVRHLAFRSAFDAAICLYDSFGIFSDAAQDLRQLQEIRAALKPGGRLLLEVTNRDVMVLYPTVKNWKEIDVGYVLEETRMDWSRNVATTRQILVRAGRQSTESQHHIRLYALSDISNLLTASGFVNLRFFGNLQGGEYHPLAPRLDVLAATEAA